MTTVLNDAAGLARTLRTLECQTRMPEEVLVVDGGSTDGTPEVVRQAAARQPAIRLILAPGANIGRGRNLGIENASGDVIVSTDSGCLLDPRWVEEMAQPFEEDGAVEFVAGCYRIDSPGLFEGVVGAVTMRGVLEPIDPETFNPSCRSMAYTKALWQRAGRFPEWTPIDDTLFNLKVRRMRVCRRFAPNAFVAWRPRSSLAGVYRQFRFYASSRGHTQVGAESLRYNLRNLAVCVGLSVAGLIWTPLVLLAVLAFGYFFLYAFHGKSWRIAARLGTWRGYPLSILVHWAVVLGGVHGYVQATVQRWRSRGRYQRLLGEYLGATVEPRRPATA